MVEETSPSAADFIFPLLSLKEQIKEEITSMPNIFSLFFRQTLEEIEECYNRIRAFAPFPSLTDEHKIHVWQL
jgi:delta-aminolevulinic acid dehydratase/porphobilinogen synthase